MGLHRTKTKKVARKYAEIMRKRGFEASIYKRKGKGKSIWWIVSLKRKK